MVPGVTTNRFQKIAAAALVSVLVLIFVGAIVRVSGAGLGCPDWPTCWGCLIPPWKVEQVDLDKLDFEKFQRKAERHGMDPERVSRERILESFNPRHVWTEFINRLFSLPVGILSLATLVASLRWRRRLPLVTAAAFVAVVLVGVNAVMGARVVYSGLKPGVLTLHMALAMLLIAIQSFIVWRGTEQPWRLGGGSLLRLRWILFGLLALVVVEGIMGTQIREMTDEMAKSHHGEPRAEWIGELERSALYLAHRSFSWVIVAVTAAAAVVSRKTAGRLGWPGRVVVAVVAVQMLLGVVMAHIQVHPVAQVLHVGLAALLLSALVFWCCGTFRPGRLPAAGIAA